MYYRVQLSMWSAQHRRRAREDGWQIVKVKGVSQIRRLPNQHRYRSDAEVWERIWRRAWEHNDDLCMQALIYMQTYARKEYEYMRNIIIERLGIDFS